MNRYRYHPLELCGVFTDGVEFQLVRCIWIGEQYVNQLYSAGGPESADERIQVDRVVTILAHMISTSRDVYGVCSLSQAQAPLPCINEDNGSSPDNSDDGGSEQDDLTFDPQRLTTALSSEENGHTRSTAYSTRSAGNHGENNKRSNATTHTTSTSPTPQAIGEQRAMTSYDTNRDRFIIPLTTKNLKTFTSNRRYHRDRIYTDY